MSTSEFAFLALGLVLGLATGAGLLVVLRARPSSPRRVRLTMTADSVPRRVGSTLAGLTVAPSPAAGGGPADPATLAASASPAHFQDREPGGTPVLNETTARLDPAARGRLSESVPVLVRGEQDLDLRSAIERSAGGIALANRLRTVAPAQPLVALASTRPGGGGPPASLAAAPAAAAHASETADLATSEVGVPDALGPASRSAPDPNDPCSEARQTVEDRCGLAERLRALAASAEATLREQQRAYDDHVERAEAAERAVDPRALRAAKEAARDAFRLGHERAAERAGLDAAARVWLAEINSINTQARSAATTLQRERQAAAKLGPGLERLVVETDAARINAEAAMEACLAAREALAGCEEARTAVPGRASGPRQASGAALVGAADRARGAVGGRVAGPDKAPSVGDATDDEPGLLADADERPAAIVRLLRGDRATLLDLVGRLAADDVTEQRHWQLLLTDLVDGVIARAIEAGWLDYPREHTFWGMFTPEQDRDIGRALASLGYRFDGLGGFADGRVPSQRDLSLAIGYAALDPMRIRRGPTEKELPDLLRDVSVAADQYLAVEAGGLTLGELVALLGGRADPLADLWNGWGRVRPLLLDTA